VTTLVKSLAHTFPRKPMWGDALSAIALVAISIAGSAQASDVAGNNSPQATQGSNMTRVTFGTHAKQIARSSDRERIRAFYHDLLGFPLRQTGRADFFKFGDSQSIGVIYDDTALSDQDLLKSIWLELETDDPAALKQKILKFGIAQIPYWDKEHFYFQAPGGQVFRLCGTHEDTSKGPK
jgi:hypothetical protein